MKSILIEKPNQLAIIEREIPTPAVGEVRVKVKFVDRIVTFIAVIIRLRNIRASLVTNFLA